MIRSGKHAGVNAQTRAPETGSAASYALQNQKARKT